jgi:heterodisulfide reductase subunit A-like polyferredoxin
MGAPRIGVYICQCGTNIAATVDVADAAQRAAELPGVAVSRGYVYMCSDPGQALIEEDIRQYHLDRVVVAACSPRMHEKTFREAAVRAGLNGYLVEIANIREQCAWVHRDEKAATAKAIRLIDAAISRSRHLSALDERRVAVEPAAAIVGGGVAGIVAALDLAAAGFQVHVVERSAQLGGRARELARTYPDMSPVAPRIDALLAELGSYSNVTTHLGCEIVGLEGYVGNFALEIGCAGSSTRITLSVGTVIVATGFSPFDAARKPELGYGRVPQVVTTRELEQRLGAQTCWPGEADPKSVAFVQCVGSRDSQVGNPYCSRACCMVVAKQARTVRQTLPDAQVTVFHMDVRTFQREGEEFYDRVRREGVLYRRGNVSEVYLRGNRAVVVAEDTVLGRTVRHEADLVVLAVGMEPANGAPSLSGLLKLPRSSDGFFLELHPKLRPVDTAVDGIYVAGCCQGPKDLGETVAHAHAAASSALIPLLRATTAGEAATAVVDSEACAGCGLCATDCQSGAAALDSASGVARINPVLCKGCGSCAVTCPSSAITLQHGTARQLLAQVDALMS